jgi:anti-anti-sigma factor
MTHPAQITLAPDQPPGVAVVDVVPPDRRLVTGLQAGPAAQATSLIDDLTRLTDPASGPVVLNLGEVDWIDSGACAVLIRLWKALRAKGRALTLRVTPPVRETFQITGLVRLIPCFGDLGEAVEAARTGAPAGGRA